MKAKLPLSRITTDAQILEENHDVRRAQALNALEALETARRYALLQLRKTYILFKYLNWKQQESVSNYSGGNFSLQKMYALSAAPPADPDRTGNMLIPLHTEKTASYIQRVKTLRKNMVQFGMVEARAVELTNAIVNSITAFNHHYKEAYRKLFPLGVVSKVRRSITRFFDHPYFSWQEMDCLRNLGAAAGFVLKMAEAPVAGAGR